MNFSTTLNAHDLAITKAQVDSLNKSLGIDKAVKGHKMLGKEDFLKLLMTQLTHQDPTKPMTDTAFIAQMAQFSALEQMTNISQGFTKLTEILTSSRAVDLLGKKVQVVGPTGKPVEGVVKAVSGDVSPQLLIDGEYYGYSDVQKVME